MKLQVWRSTVRVLGVLVAAVCVIWACSTPVKVGVKVEGFGIKIEVGIDSTGNPVTTATGSAPPGKCLRVTYHAADGTNLGSNVISVPGSSPIPTGSATHTLELVDCPEPPSLTGPTPLPGGSHRVHALPTWREVYTFPITVSGGTSTFQRGVVCHARVRCLPTQDPMQILQPILLAGPGVAVPATIDVLFLTEITPTMSGAQVRVAARSPILDMNFEWNDTPNFADLGSGTNAISSTLPNGWHAVDASIPGLAFRPDLGDWNGGRVRIRTLAQPVVSEYAQSFQTLGF